MSKSLDETLFSILLFFSYLFLGLVDYLVPGEAGISTLFVLPTILVIILFRDKKQSFWFLLFSLFMIILGGVTSIYEDIGFLELFLARLISIVVTICSYFLTWTLVRSQFTTESYENLFKSGLENTPLGLLYVNEKGEIIYSNKWISNLFGYTKQELIGKPVEVLVPKSVKEIHPELRDKYFHAPSTKTLGIGRKLYGKHKSGDEFLVDIGLSPLITKNETLAIATIVQTTEKEILLKELEQKNTILNFAMEETNDGWWDWHIQDDYEYMSPRFWKTFGYDPKLKKHHPSEWQDIIHPEDLKVVLENFNQHCKTKGAHPYYQEVRYRHFDGHWVTVICKGKVIEWSIDGQALRMIGAHIDITKMKQQELKLESYMKGSKDGFWSWNLETNQVTWDQNLYDHLKINSAKVKADYELFMNKIHPIDAKEVQKSIEDHISLGTPYDKEFRINLEDEGYVWFRGKGEILKTKNGQPKLMAGSISNINEKKLLEQKLKRSNQELEQFAYIASHDLKAPLRGIANLTRYIEEDLADTFSLPKNSSISLNLVRLKLQIKRMKDLISGILSYSRVQETSGMSSKVNLFKLVENVAAEQDVKKIFIFKNNCPNKEIITNEIQLNQVFSNLISNAIKYHHNPKGGIIEIGFSESKKSYHFYVSDNGPGIDKKYHEKIFKIFQTLKSKDDFEATGIGLTIVKKIIESNEGQIEIKSAPNEGTTFSFSWKK